MEKNNQDLKEDALLKKYVKEIELDQTKANFTSSIMDVILTEETKKVKESPLISKKMWFVTFGFSAVCLLLLFKDKSTSVVKLPNIDFSFLTSFKMPNIFVNLSMSSTVMYAIVTFTVLILIQLVYLKNYFDKQLDS